jgi:type II secretory pathway pseudopilin PulG
VRLTSLSQREQEESLDVGSGRDAGMTLVELLIVLVIMPMVIGAIALALVTSLEDSSGTSARLAESSDVQVASEFFGRDIESAASVTTSSSVTECGSGTTPLLSITFSPGGTGDEVTYWEETVGTSYELMRDFCSGGAPTSAVLSTTLQSATAIEATVSPSAISASGGWISTSGISAISLQGVEESFATGSASSASTAYPLDLQASPRVSTPTSQGVDPGGTP